jgi:6,7-dimethyl-8-ribityllumazine synthase
MVIKKKNVKLPVRKTKEPISIGIVQSRFHQECTDKMVKFCKTTLIEQGVDTQDIDHIQVPGALEIPIALKAFALEDKYDVLIAIGCVIRGETYHFELVAQQSATGISQVALENAIPIINAVLTVENATQLLTRQEVKAVEAAHAAIEMADTLRPFLYSDMLI